MVCFFRSGDVEAHWSCKVEGPRKTQSLLLEVGKCKPWFCLLRLKEEGEVIIWYEYWSLRQPRAQQDSTWTVEGLVKVSMTFLRKYFLTFLHDFLVLLESQDLSTELKTNSVLVLHWLFTFANFSFQVYVEFWLVESSSVPNF